MAKNTPNPSPKPVHTIRLGRIKAAIWANKTDAGVRHNITVQRLYLKDDEWMATQSFGRDDLPLLCKVIDMAHTWLYQKSEKAEEPGKKDGKDAEPEPAEPQEGGDDVPGDDDIPV